MKITPEVHAAVARRQAWSKVFEQSFLEGALQGGTKTHRAKGLVRARGRRPLGCSCRGKESMSEREMRCPKCSAAMEEGFILDQTQEGARASEWIGDPAEKSFWLRVEKSGKAVYTIHSYRCVDCGFLESYAR